MMKPRKLNPAQFRALLMFATHLPFGPPEITPQPIKRHNQRDYTYKITFGPIDVSSQFKSLERRGFVRLNTHMSFQDGDHQFAMMRDLVVKRSVTVTKRGQEYLDNHAEDHLVT